MRDERRWLRFVAAPAFGDESVAHPWLGLDVLAARFALEFLAQLADEDSQVLGLMRGLCAPDRRQQGAMCHHLTGVASQVQQQLEFLGREMGWLALNGEGVRLHVNYKVACFEGGSGALRRAPQMRSDPSQQLLNAEWLGYIVVGARIQRFHFRPLVLADRKHQHRRGAPRADGTADLDSAPRGHPPSGDDQIPCPVTKDPQALLRLIGRANIVSLS